VPASDISIALFLLFGFSWNVVTSLLFLGNDVLGLLEGILESILKTVVGGGSLALGLSLILGLLGLEGLSLSDLSLLLGGGENLCLLLGEWVQFVHHGFVGEWVLLGLVVDSNRGLHVSQLGLNLIGVDDSGKISAGHNVSVELVSGFLEGTVSVGTEDGVEGLEGILGEDEESSKMSTWGKLEDVKSVDVASVNTWEVLGLSLDGLGIISVDDQWTFTHDVSGVSIFTSSGSDVSGLSNLGEVWAGTEGGQSGEEGFSVWSVQVLDNEWEFWNLLNSVSSSHDQRSACGGSEGSDDGMSSLGKVALSVPLSPDLKWSEHSSLSAHITESSLS